MVQEDKKSQIVNDMLIAYLAAPTTPFIKFADLVTAISYVEGVEYPTFAEHNGQIKLFADIIQFTLTVVRETPNATIIYAGAAPSNYSILVAAMFPQVKYIFVDPNKFRPIQLSTLFGDPVNVYTKKIITHNGPIPEDKLDEVASACVGDQPGIYFINSYMDARLARSLRDHLKLKKYYFMSDIRTNSSTGETTTTGKVGVPDVYDINLNMAIIHLCIVEFKKMGECLVRLKHRHPFYTAEPDPEMFNNEIFEECKRATPPIDFYQHAVRHEVNYWAGDMFIQAFAPLHSTEMRLQSACEGLALLPPPEEYDAKLCAHNNITRSIQRFTNEYVSTSRGFDECHDCSLVAMILADYCEHAGIKNIKAAIWELLDHMKIITSRSLLIHNHGRMIGRIPFDSMLYAATQWEANHNNLLVKPQATMNSAAGVFTPRRNNKYKNNKM